MKNKTAFAVRFLLWQIPLLLLAVAYAVAYGYAARVGSSFFDCRISSVLHLYCPGCGGSRAIYALVRGHVLEALRYYAPLPIAAVLLAVTDLRMLLFLKRGGDLPSRRFGYACLIFLVGSVILQCILRNILLCFEIDYVGDILT